MWRQNLPAAPQRNLHLPPFFTAVWVVVLAVQAIAAGLPAPAQRCDVLVTGGQLVDPRAQTVAIGHLCIVGTVIAHNWAVLPDDVTAQERVDAAGLWVMPALGDAHDHTWGDPSATSEDEDEEIGTAKVLLRNAAAGVATVLDLGRNEFEIFPLRDRQRALRAGAQTSADEPQLTVAADIFAAGPVLVNASPPGLTSDGWARRIDSPDSARQQVQELAAKHPDVVKLIYDHSPGRSGMTYPVYEAAVAEARRLGLRTVVHIALWQDMREAIRARPTAITHLDDDGDVPADIVQALKDHNVASIPTLGVQVGLADLANNASVRADPLLRELTDPKVLASWSHPKQFLSKPAYWQRWQTKSRSCYLRSVLALHKGGVRMLVGPDGGNHGVVQGWSVHRELELWQQAGVPPWVILRAATNDLGDFLGIRLGVHAGDRAHLLFVAADPTVSVANTHIIRKVMIAGRIIDRAQVLQASRR